MAADSGKKISLTLGGGKKSAAPSNGVKRPRAALHENGEADEADERATKVSHFDRKAGGAVDESKPKTDNAPLVIARQANRNWKDAANLRRKQKNSHAGRDQGSEAMSLSPAPAVVEATSEANKDYGLVTNTSGEGEELNGQTPMEIAEETQPLPPEPNGETFSEKQSEDQAAMDALLGKTRKSDLVVPAMSEEEAFQNDITTAPDMASLEDYSRVPVEQFGAAMLRGMGWKDGEGIGAKKGQKVEKTKIPERRPALLGIGAKEEAAVASEMGAWGKAARGKKGQEPQIYNPVLLRDKQTGEMFTEQDLQKKKEKDEKEQYELEFEQKERDREKRRRRDDEEDERARRKEKERRRDRRDDRDRRNTRERDRRRYDDSEDEEERRRRKDKEHRRRERERDDDYDRERSRRHGQDGHRRRDKSRDHRR